MNHSPTQSPVEPHPTVIATMDFFEALRQVAKGETITKLEWDNPRIKCQMMPSNNNAILMIFRADIDSKWHSWIINDGDMAGTDWIVI